MLADHHLQALHQSAIADTVIVARGYRTIEEVAELRGLGFAPAQCRVPGLLLPLHGTDGSNSVYVFRPDNPRLINKKRKDGNPNGTHPTKVIKYEYPKGAPTHIDCPPTCRPMLKNPTIPLWITEGQKKADALASADRCAIALLGVWNFKGKNEFGGTTLLTDFDLVAFDNREVRIVFDSDVMTNQTVRQALDRLTEHLQRKGARVSAIYLPNSAKGKMGVDDFLAAGHSATELEDLIEAPRPAPKPAPPKIEFLQDAPPTIRRPLALVNGRAYAATWAYVRVTRTESVNKQGKIVIHDPPIVTNQRRLFIVRDDGRIFGEGGDEPMENLGAEVILPEIPPADRLWSGRGVEAFRARQRVDPIEVFRRLVKVVDRFIDFERSLGDQATMAELTACYILVTWLLDAFNVVGILWPNGEKGSGKTHFLLVITELGYLGLLILSGGSYASLRDMADYGATLAFDDAEAVSDPKKMDPDKRALFLAGNRRGAVVSVKELGPDRTWRTRHVNAFSARLFSAIRLPDSVLGSRTIVVPLIRTDDRKRANSEPLDYSTWPCDRRKLIDDLWALALAHLPELHRWDEWVGRNARLAGRDLEPWRAVLAVAKWLDVCGVTGFWEKMDDLSSAYQNERPGLEMGDITPLVIQGLFHCARCASCSTSRERWVFGVRDIAEAAAQFDDDAPDPNPDPGKDPEGVRERRKYIKSLSQRTGWVLRRMRLKQLARSGGKGSRQWEVTLKDLLRWASVYGIELDQTKALLVPDHPPTTGTSGTSGTVAQADLEDRELWEGEL